MTNQEKKWYILQTMSGMETKSKNLLVALIKENEELRDHFGQIIIPSENLIQTQRNGKNKRVEVKLYPGYLFVEMDMNFATFDFIRNVNYIIGFLGAEKGKQPNPVADHEMQSILDKMNETAETPRPQIQYEVGEKVRIVTGPFEEFVGTIEAIDTEKSKAKITIQILGRNTPVDIELSNIIKE